MLLTLCATLPLLASSTPPPTPQEGDARQRHIAGVESMIDSRGDAPLRRFAEEHLSDEYAASFDDEAALLAHLRAIREAAAPVGGVGLDFDPESGGFVLSIFNRERESRVLFVLEEAAPRRIVTLELVGSKPRVAGPEFTWDTLEEGFEEAEAAGFCGSMIAVRGGEVLIDRGYGFADPDQEHPVTPDTLFAIGSTPIDFTLGGILLLAELGVVSLDDPITRWFEDVPEDKRGITLSHLQSGGSGLIDFPGLPGVDENLDLSWIDRDEFLRRTFASELLFEPGTSRRHSHMAWGLLAAVIEVATEETYDDFLRTNFFEPAGMERTGDYEFSRKFPASEVAVGLGGNTWGEVNSPPHWGPTSWLVLGSGGMVSTPRDLYRWRQFLASGEVLSKESQMRYGLGGVNLGEGGNDRGFVTVLGNRGTDDVVIVCSNSHVSQQDYASMVAIAAGEVAMGE